MRGRLAGSHLLVQGPRIPLPVSKPVAATFRALSRARGRRIFHPHGVAFSATLRGDKRDAGLPALLSEAEPHRVTVRLSRAAGLPPSLPDVLGLAIRVHGRDGEPRQDLLLVTSSTAPGLRHLLLPSPGGWFSRPYSSLLPYALPGGIRLVGAAPEAAEDETRGHLDELRRVGTGQSFRLSVASLAGRWRGVGRLELGELLTDEAAEAIRYNPWHADEDFRPTGPLMGLRDPAYRGSQEGRSRAHAERSQESLAADRGTEAKAEAGR